jgi:hypothetical protein
MSRATVELEQDQVNDQERDEDGGKALQFYWSKLLSSVVIEMIRATNW